MNKLRNYLLVIMLLTGGFAFSQKKEVKEAVFKTEMDCTTCKNKIEKHFAFTKGVKSVVADLESNTVTIGYKASKTNEENLKDELIKLGFPAEIEKTEEQTSKEALPNSDN